MESCRRQRWTISCIVRLAADFGVESKLLDASPRSAPGARGERFGKLSLISCWRAPGRRFVGELRERLPGVAIQGKGLLARGGNSIPLVGRPRRRSHHVAFLEFIRTTGGRGCR